MINNSWGRTNEIIYIWGAVLIILIPNIAGIMICLISALVMISEGSVIGIRKVGLAFLLGLSFIVYTISLSKSSNLGLLSGGEWTPAIIDVMVLLGILLHVGNCKQNPVYDTQGVKQHEWSAYCVLYAFCAFEVVKYIVTYRIYGGDPRAYSYANGLHESDFGAILIVCLIWGLKAKKLKSSVLLSGICFAVIPSRTYQCFVLLVITLLVCNKLVEKILSMRLFNTYFKIILWLIVLMQVFASIWVLILSWRYELNASHVGIFDISNEGRMESIIYSLRVIIQQGLYFQGLPISTMGSTSYSGMASMAGLHEEVMFFPHNTYMLILIHYSVFAGLILLYVISKVLDKVKSRTNNIIILSYLITACILHNMLSTGRLFLFLVILMMPEYGEPLSLKSIGKVRIRP